MDKQPKKFKKVSEKIGLFFSMLCLIWLIDNTTNLLSSPYSLGKIVKSELSKNIEIFLAIVGVICGMELRNGKIKLPIGIGISGIIILIGIILKVAGV